MFRAETLTIVIAIARLISMLYFYHFIVNLSLRNEVATAISGYHVAFLICSQNFWVYFIFDCLPHDIGTTNAGGEQF